jgi:hypothetical protein
VAVVVAATAQPLRKAQGLLFVHCFLHYFCDVIIILMPAPNRIAAAAVGGTSLIRIDVQLPRIIIIWQLKILSYLSTTYQEFESPPCLKSRRPSLSLSRPLFSFSKYIGK